jgi:hypothetical protein
MDIQIKAEVACADGHGGHVERVVIDPIDMTVVGLVVREPGLIRHDVVVPLQLVTDAAPDKVTLSITRDRLSQLPEFVEKAYMSYNTSKAMRDQPLASVGFEGSAVLMPYRPLDEGAFETVERTIPAGDLVMRRGDDVYASDGKIGDIEGFLVDPKTRAITHLTLSEGHFWGKKEVSIAVSHVERMDNGQVHLKLTKAEIEALSPKA